MGIIYKIYLCIILVVILSVGLALLYSDYELDNMNNEHQALREAVNSILEKDEDELIELIEVTEL